MSVKIVELLCPGCGAAVGLEQKKCKYCSRPIIIQTFDDMETLPPPVLTKYTFSYKKQLEEHPESVEIVSSLAMCYLKLRMFDEAYNAFMKSIESSFDDADLFFYASLCVFKGKKAFLQMRPQIDKALELLNAAIMIEPKGIYYYYMAYIKYDYFKRKFLNTTPSYKDCLMQAKALGYSQKDVAEIFTVLGVDPVTMA